MGAIQNSINQIIGSVAAGTALAGKLSGKPEAEVADAKVPEENIDIKMRERALRKAQHKIDAINSQKMGKNARMKQIRGVIDDFSKQDFTIKGGKK